MNCIKIDLIILITLVLSSCDKTESIEQEQAISQLFDYCFFRGIRPHITYNELLKIAGEPDELKETGRGEEYRCNPVYYKDNGVIKCEWKGASNDRIENIIFRPFNNRPIDIRVVLCHPAIDKINKKTKKLEIKISGTLLFKITLNNYKITRIEFCDSKEDLIRNYLESL